MGHLTKWHTPTSIDVNMDYNKYITKIPPNIMRSKEDQLIKDIEFCIDKCNMNDEQIGFFLRGAEELGVSAEYFAEEFVFETASEEEFYRLHVDPDYLAINWRLN